MIRLSTKQLSEIINAELIGKPDVFVQQISTDTRTATEQGLFFALKGANFDAHHYLDEAKKQGALAVVVEYQTAIDLPQLIVSETKLALGQLAAWLKAKIKPKTIAITGSSGKTTVKEICAAILQKASSSDAVLYTKGNLNNEIGVPLTLLDLTEQHQYAVIELGANHIGEIAYTSKLIKPDVALVNNVAVAHLEGFGSLEGVVQAKGEIYQGLAENGIAVINLDCHYLSDWQSEIGNKQCYSFSIKDAQADFYADQIELGETGAKFRLHCDAGSIEIQSAYLGLHNISNALAATALTMSLGASLADVKAGLAEPSLVKGRLYPIQPCHNLLLLDDSYNANLASMLSAIEVLQKYPAFRIFVVGDMAELGENSAIYHQQVAREAQQANLDLVLSLGQESAVIANATQGKHFSDKAELISYLKPIIEQKLSQQQRVVLLAKGSRKMKMEEIINLLREDFLC